MRQGRFQSSRRSDDFTSVLADLNRLTDQRAGNLHATYSLIAERAARMLNASRANVWLFTDSERKTLKCVDHYDLATDSHSSEGELPAETFPTYVQALNEERVIRADDAATNPHTSEFAAEYLPANNIKSMLDAPIRQDGEAVGVICVEQAGEHRTWTDEEANFVGTLSDFATLALTTHHKSLAETALVQAQKMESLGRLAGGIAHDFNNLLTVISGAVETMQIKLEKAGLHEDRLLTLIAEAGERARKLTRNLLAFGGQQHLILDHISTRQIIATVQELTEGIIREDIKVTFRSGEQEFWTIGDQTQLEQVLLNLIINGVDAIEGPGELTIEVLPLDEHNRIGFAIADTGCGMSTEVQQRIFDPFFTTKGDLGTGLGLSISLGIVQQHGGTLRCVDSSAAGTRFELRLPRSDAPDDQETPRDFGPDTPEENARYRLLLVEDEQGVRDVVSQMLKSLGYQLLVAEDARHALELLKGEHVDLMVTDVIMPDMRGPELYQKALLSKPDLSTLFVSGYSEEVFSSLPREENQIGYLAKPFTVRQLRDAINEILPAI